VDVNVVGMDEPLTGEEFLRVREIAGDHPDLFRCLVWIERAVSVMRHMNDCIEGEWGSREVEADKLCAGFPEELRAWKESLSFQGQKWPWERLP
jgi:hypothetical protein